MLVQERSIREVWFFSGRTEENSVLWTNLYHPAAVSKRTTMRIVVRFIRYSLVARYIFECPEMNFFFEMRRATANPKYSAFGRLAA